MIHQLHKLNNVLVIMCILAPTSILGVTIVYNMRIAETTKAKNSSLVETLPSIGVLTPFVQFRNHNNPLTQSTGGLLGTYIYADNSWYARINAAVGRVHADSCTLGTFSRTQTDDILLSGGHGWNLTDACSVSLSGHLGIPTHNDDSLQLFQLGTGHVALGAQLDGAYAYGDTQAFLGAVRFIHFFPRDVTITVQDVTYNLVVNIANALDLLMVYQHTWGPHLLGIGYNPTLTFGSSLKPSLIEVKTNTTVNSFFCSYRYDFLIDTMLSAVIFGISYGFGSTPIPDDKVHITTAWFSWGINF